MAPAILLVGGASSFLFASYAIDRSTQLHLLIRRADRAVIMLGAVVASLGLFAVLFINFLGPALTAGRFELSAVAVGCWAGYFASVAVATPYGSLAAVRGKQRTVPLVRVGDSLLALALAAGWLAAGGSVDWVPALLTLGSVAGGVVLRQLLVRTARSLPALVIEGKVDVQPCK